MPPDRPERSAHRSAGRRRYLQYRRSQVDSDLFEADYVAANRHAQADERIGLHILQGGAQCSARTVVADGQLAGHDAQVRAGGIQRPHGAFCERHGGVDGHAGERSEVGQ